LHAVDPVREAARIREQPWYTHEAGTTFSNKLATPCATPWRERF
jgi:hypothetical protein